jgi:uncharacterized membrane protein YbhN (UPF0104 family)
MIGSIFWNILGLLIQVLGAGMCLQSFVIATPKVIADALADIHGNRLRDRNLDSNRFLDTLIRQSFDAQGGFFVIILGAMIQAVSSLFTPLYSTQVSWVVALVVYCTVLPAIWFAHRAVSRWRRNRAKRLLVNPDI